MPSGSRFSYFTRKDVDGMEQFKIGSATVRIHGNPDRERIEAATLKFLKAAEQQRRKVRNEARKEANRCTTQADPEMGA